MPQNLWAAPQSTNRDVWAMLRQQLADTRQFIAAWRTGQDGRQHSQDGHEDAARRTNLETDAECILVAWWNMLTVDKEFLPRWRQSKFPGGIAHACELETSLYLYLDGDNVRKDKIKNGVVSFNQENSPFNYVDLFGQGPVTIIPWNQRSRLAQGRGAR